MVGCRLIHQCPLWVESGHSRRDLKDGARLKADKRDLDARTSRGDEPTLRIDWYNNSRMLVVRCQSNPLRKLDFCYIRNCPMS